VIAHHRRQLFERLVSLLVMSCVWSSRGIRVSLIACECPFLGWAIAETWVLLHVLLQVTSVTAGTILSCSFQARSCRVTNEIRQKAEALLQYQFKDSNLLTESLTHASIANTRLVSNERMEFLGDAVLDVIVCEALYLRFPEFLEGDLTKIKSAVVSRKTCAEISNETGLTALLITGKGISSREEMPSSLAAAVYESIIAALYLDGGFEVVKAYVLRTMTPKIEVIAADTHQQNYKAVLQQHAQKSMGATPIYELMDEKGPDHSKCFEVCVVIDGKRFTSAWGPNKKTAEQKAALFALEELGVIGRKSDELVEVAEGKNGQG
jgi:ribonuclease-3